MVSRPPDQVWLTLHRSLDASQIVVFSEQTRHAAQDIILRRLRATQILILYLQKPVQMHTVMLTRTRIRQEMSYLIVL